MRIHYLPAAVLGFAGLLCAQTPVIAPGGVLNAASNDKSGQPVPAGALVSIYGTDLSAATAAADTVPLSTTLSNVKVTFNAIEAPLLLVTPGQINAQVPFEALAVGANTGTAQVVVTRNGVASAPLPVNVGVSAPGIF